MFRFTNALRSSSSSSSSSSKHASSSVDAVVVGAGPSGIAVMGSLLQLMPEHHQHHRRRRQLWVDPLFQAGRVHARYREVPSNTKVELFSKFATTVDPFRRIVDHAPSPNAFTALGGLPQDKGCQLSFAADMCLALSDGLARHFEHSSLRHQGRVTAASLDKSTNLWSVSMDQDTTVQTTTPRLILCTGSSPIEQRPPVLQKAISQSRQRGITTLHLDTALMPSELTKAIPSQDAATIAVIGASHSAILVLMNLYQLASTTHPNLRIKWFTRHKDLRYAQYMDGWILYDNTGLKGQAAQWARENLEDNVFASSPVSRVVSKLWTPPEAEASVYEAEIPACSHVVQAIGYQRDPVPRLTTVDGPGATPEPVSLEHDGLTGRFFASAVASRNHHHIPGLFGAGIAFPERVTDRAGNVEHAVGFWKFMNFCKRVVPQWVESPVRLT